MGLSIGSYLISSKEVPGRWSLVVFLKGCNFRCRHCYNWRLITGEEKAKVKEEEVLYEVRNQPFLECVVLSGGEPTVSSLKDMIDFICRVKEIRPDIRVRVDTNGSEPEALRELKEVVDGFAVDIKSPLEKPDLYSYTAGVEVDTDAVEESIRIADGMPLTLYRTPRYPWLGEGDIVLIKTFTDRLRSPWHLNRFFEVPDCPFNRP
ncbi:MAG: radical SAM protein [Aquificota bacterium]|nr:radical SAM protein [Aquificota bacterium]MDQ7083356.1 radical SAM protein [Aquificota bacterium]